MTEAGARGGEENEEPEPGPDIRKLFDLFQGPLDIRSVALSGIFILSLLYTMYFARSFLLPIVLALLLTFLLAPVVRGLKRLHIPEGIGAALVILAMLSAVIYGVQQLSGPAAAWVEKAPEGMRRAERRILKLRRPVQEVQEAAEEVEQQVNRMTGRDDKQEVTVGGRSLSGAVLNQTQSFLAGAVVMLILLYFLLASGDLFLRKLVRVLPRLRDKRAAIEIARATEHHISTYLSTVTLINAGLGIVVGVAMTLIGMPNPILWGVTAAILNYIPYLGAIVMVRGTS
ncbi:hypothetical protein BH18GEM1_BH18GEM1_15760 [soil metagenome]